MLFITTSSPEISIRRLLLLIAEDTSAVPDASLGGSRLLEVD